MHGDVPAPVRPLERGERGLVLEEDFGERVDDALGRAFIANGKAGAVGGGGEGHAGGEQARECLSLKFWGCFAEVFNGTIDMNPVMFRLLFRLI